MVGTEQAPQAHLLSLRAPSANRVYTDAAGRLALAEARCVLTAQLGVPVQARARQLAGADYVEISAAVDRAALVRAASFLSTTLALFVPRHVEATLLLEPVEQAAAYRHGSELETTLRYPGKTNEQFTALLLNLAAAASERRAGLADGTLAVLDPMCGRGTTLSRALRLGLSPVGADIDRSDIEAYRAFLLTWLRTHRLKHTSSTGRLSAHGKVLGTRFTAELAVDKAAQRAGDRQHLELLRCDATELGAVYGAGRFDVIVADLPYGIQHGARTGKALDRSPLAVLAGALGTWRRLLRSDGAMALALNRHTAPVLDVSAALEAAGLVPLPAGDAFRHRVDQAIDRDVIVAVRTDHPRADVLRGIFEDAAASAAERTP